MVDIITEVQGRPERQNHLFDITIIPLKWIFPYLQHKYIFVSVNKIQAKEVKWNCIKEVLIWNVKMEEVTVTLLDRKRQEIFILLELP